MLLRISVVPSLDPSSTIITSLSTPLGNEALVMRFSTSLICIFSLYTGTTIESFTMVSIYSQLLLIQKMLQYKTHRLPAITPAKHDKIPITMIIKEYLYICVQLNTFNLLSRNIYKLQGMTNLFIIIIPIFCYESITAFSHHCHFIDFRSWIRHHDSKTGYIPVQLYRKINCIVHRFKRFIGMAQNKIRLCYQPKFFCNKH